MPDNLKIKQPEDPKKINVHEQWELKYWTNKFGVTEAKLKEAVKAVGVQVSDVEKYLKK